LSVRNRVLAAKTNSDARPSVIELKETRTMRRRELLWVASWLLIGLCGCATTTQRPERLDTARACADWRWIGITSRPEVQCPEVPGWTVKPLFSQVAPPADFCQKEYARPGNGPGPELIRELDRFCAYEIKDAGKRLKDLPFPPAASADLVRFDQDCAALAITADSTKSETDWKANADRFFEQAGKIDLPEVDGSPAVRLAFLDTHPTGEGVPRQWWNSGHGYALAHIARNLLCTPEYSERCAARITTQLALPILQFDPKDPKHYKTDETRGGYLGLQSHLADAIRKEVDSWQADLQREGSPRHLVLNLSLAWDGDLFGGLDEEQIREMKAGTQAVYFALQYAASFDTLVLAAAGNQKREPCSNRGPLLPAAWETTGPKEGCGQPPPRSLVYAVRGVRADGSPLRNARHDGILRCAYGEEAVVPSADPEFPTEIYTGSSVATAVVSSIAAAMWNYLPHLTSGEIMNLLNKSGDLLRSAIPSAPPAYRLSLSATLDRVCQDPEHSSASFCSSLPALSLWTPEKRLDAAAGEPPALGSCQPWLYPQPDDPPRPVCLAGCPPAG
jgi:hypothetical protein